jgi:prepilin-type N-terminal cleavage/methylation domain-containing protein
MIRSTSRPQLHRRRGFSLAEVMIASAISAVAMGALVSINMLTQRFLVEGFREAQMLTEAHNAIATMTRQINRAYRLDASDASNAFTISGDYRTFEFSAPDGAGGTVRDRFRLDAQNQQVRHERRNGDGNFLMLGSQPLLNNVDEFAVDNQEGIISLVVRLKIPIPRYGDKQYTLIGRALPRNI